MSDENIHVGKLLKQFIGYWKIYLPIGLVCVIGAIIYIMLTPKEYEITARMQLLNKQEGMMSELKMLKSSGIGSLLSGKSGGGINTKDEIRLITSRNNLTEVIQQTDFQIEVTTREGFKKKVMDNEEVPISCIFPAFFLDTLSAPISIKFEIENEHINKAVIKSSLFNTLKIENCSMPYKVVLPIGTFNFIENRIKNGTYVYEITPMQQTYEKLLDEVGINSPETSSDILVLTYETSNKQRACKLLNSMMNRYNDYLRNIKLNESNLNASFVKNRLDSITLELAILEHEIEIYKQANKIPDPITYSKITLYGNEEIEKMILEAETRARMVNYVIDYMKNPSKIYSAIPILDDGIGEKAIATYNQLILDRQRLLQSSEPNNPSFQLVDNQIKEQRKILIESIESIRENLHINLETLYSKNAKLGKQVDKLPTQEREFIEMKRQQKIKETMYLFLMQKMQEKELVNSPDDFSARIIDLAYSSYKPIFPRKLIVFATAFVITCILSILVLSIKLCIHSKK